VEASRVSLPNVFGYPGPVWRRFREPAHAGVIAANGALSARVGTPASRSLIELGLQVDAEGKVIEARFQAYGCPTTIAVGEWLAEQAQGRSVAQWAEITAADIAGSLEIPEDRAHCAVLGEEIVRSVSRQAGK
jgi:NifU-like protein involved in Fe-S cluster formation